MRRGKRSCSLLMMSEAHSGSFTTGAKVTACTRPFALNVVEAAVTTHPAGPCNAGDRFPELEAAARVGGAGTTMTMVFATAEVVATDDPEGPGSARDTFPMLDATALASVAGTSMIMVFEATEAASAEDPVKSSGLGRDGRPSPMCVEAVGLSDDESTICAERCIFMVIVHSEAIRNCCL